MEFLTTSLAVLLILGPSLLGQHEKHSAPATTQPKPISLLLGLGSLHHPVSTSNPEAQRFFDQGLTLIYAFNEGDAGRSFRRAAELDPQLAIAYWGIALAIISNSSGPANAAQKKEAYEAAQKALSMRAPEHERAYVEALAKRLSSDPQADEKKLQVDYKDAMREVVKRYPDDLDAATLYAYSIMGLQGLSAYRWNKDGKPLEHTEELVAVLESVLKRDPGHLGANHFYIHAVEASVHPGRALASADMLRAMKFGPAAGHLIHMPSHIYLRIGDYEAAARSNEEATALNSDELTKEFMQWLHGHNFYFLIFAYNMQGRFEDILSALRRQANVLNPNPTPTQAIFRGRDSLLFVRFRRWDDILSVTKPDSMISANFWPWRWARGMAYAAKGETEKAEAEGKEFLAAREAYLETTRQRLKDAGHTVYAEHAMKSQNLAMSIRENVLSARIAAARGDVKSAIEFLKKGVEAEDALPFTEPPAWPMPVRESLGGLLLRNGEYAEAERVFRADLERNPRSGRSLFGLRESLKAQGKAYAAQLVNREFEAAWKYADTQLKVEDL